MHVNKRQLAACTAALVALLSVSACNSTEDTLTVPSSNDPQLLNAPTAPAAPSPTIQTNSNVAPPQTQVAPPASQPAPVATNAAAATGVSQVYFAPIVGAPVDKVTALSRRLSSASAQNGVALQSSRSASITHEIRGYFSAISDDSSTTVIHVWDVFSPDGQRVHRIQAQQTVSGAAQDPWTLVPATTMEQIADTVLSEYERWRTGRA